MPTRVRSHAKINLGLYIGAPRPDGFHELLTVYQTLEMHDFVTVSAKPASQTSIQLTSNDVRVPTDSRNTAWKIVALTLQTLEISAEVEIHIEKQLPVQGGLGAGSANAIAALIGLETELDIESRLRNWPADRLLIASKIGSDVPLFSIGGTVLGLDRGQEVYPLPDIEPTWCVVAVPTVGVSTPQAFRDWDTLCSARGLTQEASAGKLKQLSRAYASAFASGSSGVLSADSDRRKNLAGPQESALVRTGIHSWIANDFEQVVFPQHPTLREIKRLLAATGTPEAAIHASLSGSGSALFGLYLTREAAEAAVARLEQVPDVAASITRTVPRSVYWPEMIV
ncbi:4-(cytidine 5'-diphospho)-2-C-methyl-D-erythritol kinase [Terracidiphilus gabretensis]|uniref:4-(cytidine 5'-diphospho)-2-C-methyl-D-erythritol kinase n=1 Tax=Terracidiphilus gabretensis TaxID=1577687 RepID=UPI00071BCD05|nr:4-(cytidine 5'-diphospho)-2-C-methyl-D-erythritol kinase [Terracidiphilus gabretensis]